MDFLSLKALLREFVPVLVVVALVALIQWRLSAGAGQDKGRRYQGQLLGLMVWVSGVVALILVYPMDNDTQNQLLTLLGLLLTAIITLSSTTVAGNAIAGLMLRIQHNFAPGDFLQVDDKLGRVTELDLFHTEIQTEDRDLMTLPNLYLVSKPVKVVHSSGTVISASVSLGYEYSHHRIESLLLAAAQEAGLEDPFVYVTELGDFSVTYRVAGLLREVKQLLSSRSQLRRAMLDNLHGDNIEIVSPSFMNQRTLGDRTFIAPVASSLAQEKLPEEVMFDKAEKAQQLEELKETFQELAQNIEDLKARDSGTDQAGLERKQRRLQAIKRTIEFYSQKQGETK